ncbi:MAG: LLM class flavin-dependent oxidoreductase [Actinobacteria bacterium]|nr:MAG: LLM class flavin-dependent oxidoreductase [Actinomycetota bacterium]
MTIDVGIVLRQQDVEQHGTRLGSLTKAIAEAGIDHVTVGDHVSFEHGNGADGLIQATALLASHPSLPVQTGVYLLALRHPAVVARQLATLCSIAPGRLTFGVGLGGDDPRELQLCGVDYRTRGARMDEALTLVRAFLRGEPVDFHGRFFDVDGAVLRPAPDPVPPVIVGGRSDAALRRAGRLGEGWIGVWVSPQRFADATELVAQTAAADGRDDVEWHHVLQLWAGFGADPDSGRRRVAGAMERSYQIGFDRFERYVPAGTPDDVAEALVPYLERGCRRFNIVPEGESLEACIEAVSAVKDRLDTVVVSRNTETTSG